MTFKSYLANGFRQLFWNAQATRDIVADDNSFRYGTILLSMVSVLFALSFFGISAVIVGAGGYPFDLVYTTLVSVGIFVLTFLLVFLSYGITHIIARMLGGTTSIKKLFAAGIANTFAVTIVGIGVGAISLIPLLGQLIGLVWTIYTLVVFIRIVREVYQFSNARAAATVLIPVGILFIIIVLITFAFLASFAFML